jgi:hypothetical protein
MEVSRLARRAQRLRSWQVLAARGTKTGRAHGSRRRTVRPWPRIASGFKIPGRGLDNARVPAGRRGGVPAPVVSMASFHEVPAQGNYVRAPICGAHLRSIRHQRMLLARNEALAAGRRLPRRSTSQTAHRDSGIAETKNAPPARDARMRLHGLANPPAVDGSTRICCCRQGMFRLNAAKQKSPTCARNARMRLHGLLAHRSWMGQLDSLLDQRAGTLSTTMIAIFPCRAWVAR